MSVYKEVFGLDDTNFVSSIPDKPKSDTNADTNNNANTTEMPSTALSEDNNNIEGDTATKKKENTNIITFVKVKNALIRVRLEESALIGRTQ